MAVAAEQADVSGAVAGSPFAAALRDAVVAALIALGLAAPMMGLVTVQNVGNLELEPHWTRVAWAVAIVFAGRLALNLTIWRPGRIRTKSLVTQKLEVRLMALGRYLAPAAIVIAAALPFIPGVGRYEIDLGILVLTYVMLGWGLNIVVGLAGLLDLGYVAFYAVGAYSYALLAQYFGLSFWICLPLAGILASFWGVLLGFPVLRLRGDYLAIVTLAFGEIIRIVLLNWWWVTGGPNGITGIPKPSFFGIADFVSGPNGFAAMFGLKFSSIHRIIFLYYLILILALVTNYVVIRLRRLPIGRAWEALREDEIACRSLGVNTVNTKLTAFALGAMFAGFAGSFFATRQGFISPESFVFMESALILAIVVLGGMGSQFGVAIAAFAMIGGFELFREFKDYRMIVFGLVMVLVMVWRPRGLVSSRTPSVFLKRKKAISGALVQEGRG